MADSNNMKKEAEPLFSAKNKKLITDPLSDNNPITVQVLGICSALAITVQVKQALVMSISVTVVLIFSSLIISLLRKTIPSRVRIIVQLVVVAAMVILVDQVLKAFVYDVSKQLSVFVGLIITNCILMGRLEAFAMANKPWPSVLDAIGNGFGYGVILLIVGFIRELLGSGKLFGLEILGHKGQTIADSTGLYTLGYVDNGLMILPPMALITVGIIIWIQRSKNKQLIESH